MSALYTPQMLALCADLARYPWSGGLALQADARSSVCGSTITIGLDCGQDGAIGAIGLKVAACAVGQGSAAILAGGAHGRTRADIEATLAGLRNWLAHEGDLPDWPRLEALAGARDYAGRHAALLLPWEAALKALSRAH